jgi:hypothetical protein
VTLAPKKAKHYASPELVVALVAGNAHV